MQTIAKSKGEAMGISTKRLKIGIRIHLINDVKKYTVSGKYRTDQKCGKHVKMADSFDDMETETLLETLKVEVFKSCYGYKFRLNPLLS